MRTATVTVVAFIVFVTLLPLVGNAQMPDMGAILQGAQKAGGTTPPASPAAPQGTTPAGPAPPEAPAAPQAVATPLQLWHDVSLLWICAQLNLTADQAKQIAGFLKPYQEQVAAGAKLRQDLWPQVQSAVEAVLTAWATGREPSPEQKAAADDAARKVQQQQARTNAALRTALTSIYQALSDAQKAMVETREEAQAVSQFRAQFDGAPSMADYVVQEITVHRTLMPEEYAIVRTAEASRIAARLVDSRSPQYPVLRDALLNLFDMVSNWNDQQFAAQLPTLPAQVRQYLALTNDIVPKPISYEAFRKWATDPRTPKYLAIYGTTAQPLPPDPEAATDELQSALDRATLLVTFESLRLSQAQAQQLLTIVAAAKDAVKKVEAQKEQLLSPVAAQLSPLLAHMITAQPLNDQWKAWVAGVAARMKALDDSLDGQLVPVVEAVRNVLMPEQAALIDWQVPPTVTTSLSLQERAAQKKQLVAQIQDAMNLVKFLRPLDQRTFFSLRPARVEEFLSRYMRPGTPEFDRAKEQISDIILQSRAVKADQWDATLPEVAVECLRAAGQLQDNRRPPSAGRRGGLDWNGVRDMLLNPETTRALQMMLGIAPQPAQPAGASQPAQAAPAVAAPSPPPPPQTVQPPAPQPPAPAAQPRDENEK